METKSLNEITKWTALALKSRFCLFEGTFRKYHNIEGAEDFLKECVSASEALMTSGNTLLTKEKERMLLTEIYLHNLLQTMPVT